MRNALIVGINYYENGSQLYGCVDDARAVGTVLGYHGDGNMNFDCQMLAATSSKDSLRRSDLKDEVKKLFATKADIALFYFAGHGHIETTGGYILASDARRGDEGLPLSEVLMLANTSPAGSKVIILDSCHSGIAGTPPGKGDIAEIADGLTVLTASTADQYATEANGRGLFTTLFVDALNGGAANLTGDITPGSVYAHIDQSLSWRDQRPVFKTNVRQFISLRKVPPPISLSELRRIIEFFPKRGNEFKLDPTFEPNLKGRDPDMPLPSPENSAKFAILQKYNRLNLLVPVGVPHMWDAAMQSTTCRLTTLGEHYRYLVEKGRI